MNIVLIGYRGTGKSIISRILANNLHCRLYSIDEEIVQKIGKTISQIVLHESWDRFREIEREMVEEVTTKAKNSVIDCGGGVVLDKRNVIDLKRNGKTVLLVSSLEKIIERINRNTDRPPLKKGLSFEEEHRQILAERESKYQAAADCFFDTTHLNPPQIATKIVEFFKKKGWI